MKAVITFSNGDKLTVYEDDVFITVAKPADTPAGMHKHFDAYRHVDYNLIPGIMDMVLQGDYFFLSTNNKKLYNPKMIVSVESE